MITYSLAFVSSYVFVGLKSFQQLNVARGAYRWVLPVSFAMSACEIYVVAAVVMTGWGWIIAPVGLGAGLGAMSAMLLHGKMFR